MSNNKEENKDEMTEEEFEKLKNDKFKQQKLPAWRPVPTIYSTTITFLVFGAIFIAIGVVVLIYSNEIQEISIQYDETCKNTLNCPVTFKIETKMTQPIMFYYQLNNFYQNHRRYVKSKSNAQLTGDIVDDKDLIYDDCYPIIRGNDTGRATTISGKALTSDTVANPCGLIAKSFFNDDYKLSRVSPNPKADIFIDETNIAWDSDKKLKYKLPTINKFGKPIDWKDYLWIDVTNEHFMVWMRPAGLPDFRKLWGRIKEDLEPGSYTINVKNNYPVDKFQGKKFIVLSTVNAFGGKNSFLGISYIVVGCICIIMAILFIIGYNVHSGNQKKAQ
jgi:hypothetical protein